MSDTLGMIQSVRVVDGLPVCQQCGATDQWREVGSTLYQQDFYYKPNGEREWGEREDFTESDEPAFVECGQCGSQYSLASFPDDLSST